MRAKERLCHNVFDLIFFLVTSILCLTVLFKLLSPLIYCIAFCVVITKRRTHSLYTAPRFLYFDYRKFYLSLICKNNLRPLPLALTLVMCKWHKYMNRTGKALYHIRSSEDFMPICMWEGTKLLKTTNKAWWLKTLNIWAIGNVTKFVKCSVCTIYVIFHFHPPWCASVFFNCPMLSTQNVITFKIVFIMQHINEI